MEKLDIFNKLDHQIKEEGLRERFNDPNFLPSRQDVIDTFGTKGGMLWTRFNFNKENPVYELLTREYVDSLTDEFAQLFGDIYIEEQRPVVILEVGAGNGRLAHFLQENLDEKAPGMFKIIATDSGEWSIASDFPVEQIDHTEALQKYKPDIVLQSWMSQDADLSKDFRKCDSVRAYVLIGDTMCTGNPWETWGNSFYEPEKENDPIPYEEDGYERTNIDELRLSQLCRTDFPNQMTNEPYSHSGTVIFSRKK
ncbi:MAG: hypothetical protein KBC35_02360 [Candidatus Pacebacteria bacterium]|jgi:hypothetical protein|nr:hypothetical protein [Candidatus Paceibacterota bacterium]